MVHIYTGSNTTAPIGRIEDYNNTNPSRGVAVYRTLSANSNQQPAAEARHQTQFAQIVYGNGPYNLLRPNATSEILAQNIDVMA